MRDNGAEDNDAADRAAEIVVVQAPGRFLAAQEKIVHKEKEM